MVRAVMVEAQRIVSLENVPDSPWWGEGKHHFLKEYFDRSMSERQRKMAFYAEDGWWTVLGGRAVRASVGLDLAFRRAAWRAAWGGGTGRGSGPSVHLRTRQLGLRLRAVGSPGCLKQGTK